MIHLFTLHFGSDEWVDLQLKSFEKHIKVPYKTYAIFSHMDSETYERREKDFDYFKVSEMGKHIHKNGRYHVTDGHREVLPIIKENMNDSDVFMRFDSDAILIDDIDEKFIDKIKQKNFISVQEPQHEWDLNYETPHPSFWAFPCKLLNEGLDNAMGEIIEDGHSNWWGGVVKWLKLNNITYYPLNRTNKINLHPLYYGIYSDLIYHHWAGSRDMITRPDRKRAKELNLDIESIKEENHKLNQEVRNQLKHQVCEFIEYLKGEYEGEYE